MTRDYWTGRYALAGVRLLGGVAGRGLLVAGIVTGA